jgi:hypothetical protein
MRLSERRLVQYLDLPPTVVLIDESTGAEREWTLAEAVDMLPYLDDALPALTAIERSRFASAVLYFHEQTIEWDSK